MWGAARGNSYRESRTFDLNKKKELTISDILKGDKLDRRTAIYKAFLKGYFTDRDEPWTFSGSCDNAKFYLKDRLGFLFRIIPDNIDTVTTIYNSKITSIEHKNICLNSIRIDALDESIEQLNSIISIAKTGKKLEGHDYTNGNLNKEI